MSYLVHFAIVCIATNNSGDEQDDSGDEDETMDTSTSQPSSTIEIKCMGCSFDRFQGTLKELRDLGSGYKDISCTLNFEPDNIHDRNAILIEVQDSQGVCKPIGYVGKPHIKRVTVALQKQEITSVKICNLKREYRHPIRDFIYNCFVVITKTGHWEKTDHSYCYNANM